MVANIRGYTPNYKFKLINFDTPRWHTLEYANWQLLDTLMTQAAVPSIRGYWTNSTDYKEGDRVIDAETNELYRALVEHESEDTGTFAEDRIANPGRWTLQLAGVPVFRGEWAPGVVYASGDIVFVSDYIYYLCTAEHTSSPTFSPDAGYWTTIFDATQAVVDAEGFADAAETSANNANTYASASASSATAASGYATTAQNAATTAQGAASDAQSAQGAFRWTFNPATTASDPGTAEIKLSSLSMPAVTQIYISAFSNDATNPDVSAYVATWDDSSSTPHGTIHMRKLHDPENFAVFVVTGDITDAGSWLTIPVSYVTHNGFFVDGADLTVSFARTGNQGSTGSGSGDLLSDNNLSDVDNPTEARNNLGLGASNSPTFAQVNLGTPTVGANAVTHTYGHATFVEKDGDNMTGTLNVNRTLTSLGPGSDLSIGTSSTIAPASASSASFIGGHYTLTHSGANNLTNAVAIRGLNVSTIHQGTGTVSIQAGIYNINTMTGSATPTGQLGTGYGAYNEFTVNGTNVVGTTAGYYGVYGRARNDSPSTQPLVVGVAGEARQATNEGTISTAIGGNFGFVNTTAGTGGTITTGTSVQATLTNNAPGSTLGTGYGFSVIRPVGAVSGTASWGTLVGVNIQDMNPSGAGANTPSVPTKAIRINPQTLAGAYAISQEGAGINYFAGQTTIANSTGSTSPTSGALVVTGGIGLGGTITAAGATSTFGTVLTNPPTYRGNIVLYSGQTDAAANGVEWHAGIGTAGYGWRASTIFDGASSIDWMLQRRNNLATWSNILRAKNSTGDINIFSTTATTSTTTGALTVAGGVGVAGNISTIAPTLDAHVATKLYADGKSSSALGASADFNTIYTPGNYYTSDTASTNTPPVAGVHWYLIVLHPYGADTTYDMQIAMPLNVAGGLYIRNKIAAGWQAWRTVYDTTMAATEAQYVQNSGAGLVLTPGTAWAAVAMETIPVSGGVTHTPNFDAGFNHSTTLTAASNGLANPTGTMRGGQSGMIFIFQDATGNRVINTGNWGTYYKFPGGTKPTLTTTAGALDAIAYQVYGTTAMLCTFIGDIK